jgi:cytochrome c oxidase cbb3-type subunit 1
MLMFISAAAWLVIAAAFACLASIRFHAGGMLADVSWLTYGRVFAVSSNALIYGFGIQAGLAVALWLICRIGEARLAGRTVVGIAAGVWNLGVTLGLIGILCGGSTGFQWFEMPGQVNLMLLAAYIAIAGFGLVSFHHRRNRELYPSLWFLVAALFWFPWIFTTASALLVADPVRGTMQAVVAWWYANNLSSVFFNFIGLGALLYFIPKIAGRKLFSRSYLLLGFWMFAIVAPFGGIPADAPVPAWMPSLSAVSAALLVVPILALALSIHSTLGQETRVSGWNDGTLKFFLFGAVAFVFGGLLNALGPILEIFNHVIPTLYNGSPLAEAPLFGGEIKGTPFNSDNFVQFTLLTPALSQLALWGFLGMTLFGAIYHIVPELMGEELPSSAWKELHWKASLVGIALTVAPLILGGVYQGAQWNESLREFGSTTTVPVNMLRIALLGHLTLLGGAALFLGNLKLIYWRKCCPCFVPPFLRVDGSGNKTVEASS